MSEPVEHSDPEAQPWPVYFGLVEVLAEVLGAEIYKVEATQLPAWVRERLAASGTGEGGGTVKHGIGHDIIVTLERSRLVMGIRCHACQRVSYHPKDVSERYCGWCKKFHNEPGLVGE